MVNDRMTLWSRQKRRRTPRLLEKEFVTNLAHDRRPKTEM